MTASFGTRFILVMHERISLPFIMMLQAPHCPWPHPILVPVSRNCSRITSARVASGSAIMVFGAPLRLTVHFIICISPFIKKSGYSFRVSGPCRNRKPGIGIGNIRHRIRRAPEMRGWRAAHTAFTAWRTSSRVISGMIRVPATAWPLHSLCRSSAARGYLLPGQSVRGSPFCCRAPDEPGG